MHRIIRVWAREHPFGTELAQITIGSDSLSATGIVIGIDPEPYRLDYALVTTDRYVTERLRVSALGMGWRRCIELQRSATGAWRCSIEAEGASALPAPGGELAAITGALDCDLALSPLTNSMPALRHGLHERGGPVDFLTAWVSVPDLAVRPSRQRYTFLRRDAQASIVRFESLDAPFVAEVAFDNAGIVLDYPGIAHHVSQTRTNADEEGAR